MHYVQTAIRMVRVQTFTTFTTKDTKETKRSPSECFALFGMRFVVDPVAPSRLAACTFLAAVTIALLDSALHSGSE